MEEIFSLDNIINIVTITDRGWFYAGIVTAD